MNGLASQARRGVVTAAMNIDAEVAGVVVRRITIAHDCHLAAGLAEREVPRLPMQAEAIDGPQTRPEARHALGLLRLAVSLAVTARIGIAVVSGGHERRMN